MTPIPSPAPPAPTGFRLRAPAGWYELDLVDEAAENAVARLVWARCADAGLDEPLAAELTATMRRAVRAARRAGAVHATGTFQVHEDGPLIANVVVSVLTPPTNGDVLGALVAAPAGPGAEGTWRTVGTAEIDGIGTVGRVRAVQDLTLDGATVRCVVMHTVVRIPRSLRVLVVTGASPNLAEADELLDLFDRVTATLSFAPPGGTGPVPA